MQPESIKGQEVLARPDVLANDGWIGGPELIYEMMSVIPPGEAQRYALTRANTKDAEANTRSVTELIASGRRSRSIRKINHFVDRGVWMTDPPKLTREHWAGHAKWRIKALYPGAILVSEAAEIIGVTSNVLGDWIQKGLAPDGLRPPGATPKTARMVTPEILETYKKIAELRPPPGSSNWKADPRSVWVPSNNDAIECPNCACRFTVELTVRPAPAAGWVAPAEPVGQVGQVDDDDDDDDEFDPDDEPQPHQSDRRAADLDLAPAAVGGELDGRLAMRSGRVLDEALVQRMEAAVRQARQSRASLVDDGLAVHGAR